MKYLPLEKSSTRRWAQRQEQDPFRVVLLRFPTQGVGVGQTGRCYVCLQQLSILHLVLESGYRVQVLDVLHPFDQGVIGNTQDGAKDLG